MQTIELGNGPLRSSRLAYGCMRLVGDGSNRARQRGKLAVRAALDNGYTLFDHADIYAGGECESLFGELLSESPGLRDSITILSKCGIRLADGGVAVNHYDFSRDHLLRSVEASLQRLNVEQLDVLLLHRPDYLMDVDEVAATFEALQSSGKVAAFGVSNFRPATLDALRAVLPMPIDVHQVEINLHNVSAFNDGTLDQCQALSITPQAWSPLAGVAWDAPGNRFSAAQSARINNEVSAQAERYGVQEWLIALAWLLRHPAGICPIIGSTTPQRIADATTALDIDYTRQDWYQLLAARNGADVP